METHIDEKIRALEGMSDRNWQRISFNLRKHLDAWSHLNVKPTWGDMKLSYWPIICNIGVDGSTAAELSRRSMITKQNISRTLKELQAHGMIYTTENKKDKRSEVIKLTEEGKKLILESITDVMHMNDVYSQVVDKEDLEITIRTLNKIIDYHDKMAGSDLNLGED